MFFIITITLLLMATCTLEITARMSNKPHCVDNNTVADSLTKKEVNAELLRDWQEEFDQLTARGKCTDSFELEELYQLITDLSTENCHSIADYDKHYEMLMDITDRIVKLEGAKQDLDQLTARKRPSSTHSVAVDYEEPFKRLLASVVESERPYRILRR